MKQDEVESAKKFLQDCQENGNWIPLIIFAMLFSFDKLPEEIRKEIERQAQELEEYERGGD